VAGLLLTLAGCGGRPVPVPDVQTPDPTGFFADRTPGSGLDFTYRNGEEAGHFAILETLGGGVALLDYDGDGLLDVFLTGGGYYGGPDKQQILGHPCKLFKNLGNFKFKDVTQEVGLRDFPWFYTHGVAVADYDNDGWPDLLLTGWGRLALLKNVDDGKGGRRFLDVTAKAGLTETRWSTSAAWADLNGDGLPDLYVCHYVDWSFANNPPCKDYRGGAQRDVCPPKSFTGLPHVLYLNNGNGTFRDASKEAGLRLPRTEADYDQLTHLGPEAKKRLRDADKARDYGKGLGILAVNVKGHGLPDLYVANDTTDNFLYLNRGNARFEEVGLIAGTAGDEDGRPDGSMGISAADVDGTGQFSLFVANYQNESHALYRNLGGLPLVSPEGPRSALCGGVGPALRAVRGDPRFLHSSKATGVTAIGLVYVGFGAGFLDFDRDGAEDLFISNGHVVRLPPPGIDVRQPPVLLRNPRNLAAPTARVYFQNVSDQGGPYFRAPHPGRGVAFGDLNNDGRVDLVISHLNEPVTVLENVADNGNHWLGVELIGVPYRDAVGARLTLEVGDQRLVRTVLGGGSYLSANDRRIIFGLGAVSKVGRLTVVWPSGREQTWEGLAIDRYLRLVEGEREPRAFGK
jgi:hypothetical protein